MRYLGKTCNLLCNKIIKSLDYNSSKLCKILKNSIVGSDLTPGGGAGEVKPSIQTAPKAFLDPRISTALLCF